MNIPKALFIGLNTIDTQFLVEDYPHENQKVKATEFGLYAGVPATNAAITFAYLGGESHLLSSFGTHPLTQLVYSELHKYGVTTTDFTPNRNCHPIFASVITSKANGHRAVVSYSPINHDYCQQTIGLIDADQVDIILTDGFYLDVALSVLQNKDKNIPVVLDGGSWKQNLEKLLPFVDIAICSDDFFPPKTTNKQEVISFLQQFGVTQIVITQGNKPLIVVNDKAAYELEVPQIDACDTLGAGDIFHGAFCFYLSSGSNFNTALKQAAQVAANSCKHFGTREWML
jgi:sugar/nucleoside kinase (ribokinase family)